MNYKRILLKISGDLFSADGNGGLDLQAIQTIAEEIGSIASSVEMAVVNGAGNIFRGRSRLEKFDRVSSDKIGIIATVLNALALTESLNSQGFDTRLMCAFEVPGIARRFDVFRGRTLLGAKKILVLAGGTGDSYVTTDTAAVLRALELKADIVLKATDVDGVYDADPHVVPNATKFQTIGYKEVLEKHLAVMDQTAFALASENKLPILVFKFKPGSLQKILSNPASGTLIL